MRRLVAAVVVVSGCAHSYTALSYDLTHRTGGPVQTGMPSPGQRTGAVAFGVGARGAGVELAVYGHDLSLADDPYLAADLAMEVKLRPLRRGPVAGFVHGGPVRAMLYDAQAGELTWGTGLAYGLGLELGVVGVHAFADVHWSDLLYGGTAMGVTAGEARLRSVSLGVKFGM